MRLDCYYVPSAFVSLPSVLSRSAPQPHFIFILVAACCSDGLPSLFPKDALRGGGDVALIRILTEPLVSRLCIDIHPASLLLALLNFSEKAKKDLLSRLASFSPPVAFLCLFAPVFYSQPPHNSFSHLPGGLHAFLSLSNPVCRIFDQLRQQEEINAQAPFIIHIFGSSPAICPSATSDQANKPSRPAIVALHPSLPPALG